MWRACALFFPCSGKVAVKKEDLQKYHGKDTWFQLQPVSADSEVQVSVQGESAHAHEHTDPPSSIFAYVPKSLSLIAKQLAWR